MKGIPMKAMYLTAALGLGLLACHVLTSAEEAGPAGVPKFELKTPMEKISYTIGSNIGKNFKGQSINIDMKAFIKGIEDGIAGGKLLMTEAEMRDVMTAFQKEMMAKQSEAGDKNQKDGEAFLAANKQKPGVITLPSGLQYKVIKEGTGAKPKATDTVSTNYRGTLIDGTEFDSSERQGEPAKFRVDRVIKGWTEALQLMPVGSKWQLFIPSDLAYGPRGSGPKIGPNAALIFEVEVLGIE